MPKNPWELDWSGVKTAEAGSGSGTAGRVKTTPQDMQIIRDASARAETERDARRSYDATRRAVADMSTGALKASFLDSIIPEQDGTPILDSVGVVLGLPARPFIADKTWAARDHLNTVSAKVALAGSQQMKGSSSDKDTALMRMAGVSPYKTKEENFRILDEAEREGAFAQHRATLKSKWISRYGSVAAPGPNGMSYEEIAARQDAMVQRALDVRRRGLPKPPPSVKRVASGRTVIDINGNPVR